MLAWSFVVFILGVLALVDSQLNYGYIFRGANALVFMLLALGVLIRMKVMANRGYRERLVKDNIELKSRVEELKRSLANLEKKRVEENIPV